MEREEVEAVAHRLLRAMTERDFETLEEILDPEVRFRSLLTRMGGEFVGYDGLRVYFAELDGSFEDTRWALSDVVATGSDTAVIRARFQGRGRGSGIELDETLAQVWRFRDGRGVSNDVYETLEEALAAVGLPGRRPRNEEA